MILNKKYVIGTHVMWFEIVMFKEFVNGLINLLDTVENKENVTLDFCFNITQVLEKIDFEQITKNDLLKQFHNGIAKLEKHGWASQIETTIISENKFYFHTDYRRDLNYQYCKKVDFVMWGETDSFFPREAFQAIETLSQYADNQKVYRYIMSFADRKMWDSTLDPLVHPDYENITFVDDDDQHLNPDQAKSPMSIKRMNEINAKTKEFDFRLIRHPKISGASLVISSELIKAGVNIPLCLLYNDDHGLSFMAQKVLGENYMQFICKNLLHVHARRHPKKRTYILNEDNPHSFNDQKTTNVQKFVELSNENIRNFTNPGYKFYEYPDLKHVIKEGIEDE